MDWKEQRLDDLQDQMLEITKTIGNCEKKLISEDDPIIIKKLENNINQLKERSRNCQEEISSLTSQKELQKNLIRTMPEITNEDISLVINALLRQNIPLMESSDNFQTTEPTKKMAKNSLTQNVRFMLDMGLGKAKEVRHLIENFVKINISSVPENLKTALNNEYNKLIKQNIKGDELFQSLHQFSSCYSSDFKWQAAGLAVLCYFFESCEIFEP